MRLDQLLVSRGLSPSREKAQRAIMAGQVMVEGVRVEKAGQQVKEDALVDLEQPERYVGRGGLKLERALQEFGLDPAGRVALDIGASTGGFTDCLLQHGASRVHAIDVGHSQLDWKIRSDPRVVVREGLNARHLAFDDLGEFVDLCVADVSFISLTLILPAAFALLQPNADMVVLIKPQFELAPEKVGAGGIVREPSFHEEAVERIASFVRTSGHVWRGVIPSPITGRQGNIEFLAHLQP